MDFFADGFWYWLTESVQTNDTFHWREGGGYATGCTDWQPASACGFENPDLTFALYGTIGGGGGDTPIASFTPSVEDGLDITVAEGGSSVGTITISNTGDADLTFI